MKTFFFLIAIACVAIFVACTGNTNATGPAVTQGEYYFTANINGQAWSADSTAGRHIEYTGFGGTSYYTGISGVKNADASTIALTFIYNYYTLPTGFDTTTQWQITDGFTVNIGTSRGTYYPRANDTYVHATVMGDTIMQGTLTGTYYNTINVPPTDSVVITGGAFRVHGKLHV